MQSTTIKTTLKLITDDGTKGYTLSNIKENLSPEHFTRFQSWIFEQTVAEYNNEPLIYTHDFERFMKGLPPLD
jgi:hypothetical protein